MWPWCDTLRGGPAPIQTWKTGTKVQKPSSFAGMPSPSPGRSEGQPDEANIHRKYKRLTSIHNYHEEVALCRHELRFYISVWIWGARIKWRPGMHWIWMATKGWTRRPWSSAQAGNLRHPHPKCPSSGPGNMERTWLALLSSTLSRPEEHHQLISLLDPA